MKNTVLPHRRVWVEIDLDCLVRNYRRIVRHVHPMKVLAVLKANAYGLGVGDYARALAEAGCREFGVAEPYEALELLEVLRKARKTADVQILSSVLPDEIAPMVAAGVVLPVIDLATARLIDAAAAKLGKRARVHFKLDTGMGRLGILARDALAVMREVKQLQHLDCEGVFSHCPMAYDPRDPFTRMQIRRFKAIVSAAAKAGIRFQKVHMAASDAINNFPAAAKAPFTMVRTGINLHGSFDPFGRKALKVEPVLSLKTRVAQVRELPAGTTLGYGRTWCLDAPTKVATISAGYADGLPLALTNRGFVFIGGRRCKIIGRISMDYTTVDVSGVPSVRPGDEVVCFGRCGGDSITPDDWAALKGTHAYDIICSLGNRVERVPVKGRTRGRLSRAARLLALALALPAAALSSSAAELPPLELGWEFCISQGKLPKLETARRMIKIAADLGYRHIHLFSKGAFRYERHPEPARQRGAYTWADVKEIAKCCAAHRIELVPYQAMFSHMEPFLAVPKYNRLAEAPEAGVMTHWWPHPSKYPMGLCPTDDRSLPFIEDLWDELLPNFTSKYVNAGCDEFVEFDHGGLRSAAAVKRDGALGVYAAFVRRMDESLKRRGKTMMCWADVALKHPESIALLPKSAVLLDWGYAAGHPFEEQCAALRRAGFRYWVCPGTSGWNTLVGAVDNMRANVTNAVGAARRHGAEGVLLTTWGDGGHPQPWIVELPGMVFTAALVREGRAISDDELAARLDAICGCKCGKALVGYGNLYLESGVKWNNNTALATVLRHRGRDRWRPEGLTDERFAAVRKARLAAERELDLEGAPDWVRDDFALMALLLDAFEMRYRGEHDRVMDELAGRYAELWLRQNRPGGLEMSIELNLMQGGDWSREKLWN